MSDPTGNALRSAQSSGGEFFEDIDACAAPSPDAREARLLALVEEWHNACVLRQKRADEAKTDVDRGYQVASAVRYSMCADQLLAALRGDA